MPSFLGSGSGTASDSMSEGTGDSDDNDDRSEESSSAILHYFSLVMAVVCGSGRLMGVGIVVVELKVGGGVGARRCMSSEEVSNAHHRSN